ncbi:MAG: Shikimate dehydrogenase (NADP(+)) [Alphaproteobacteria bacterium MarineAlpha5_Bin12]|nr:hypothetical protein [Pelagibacteraceae bacterium]PPR40799.1 MAG: Shikimate dehydrogenase (NADP(+)) [Alphaproteobacteria bacterium MarineAlpha5_Bin12]|tara:strand:- start:19707 stop:20585 length:879 start_codon:yes stop_codon:yes gene_type:complete
MKIDSLIENKIKIPKINKFSAIIGSNPSEGARSPKLWNKTYKKMNKITRMIPLDCKSKNLNKLLINLQKMKNFEGGAIAAPYKENVAKWLGKSISKESKKIGAVNCIFRDKNKLAGTNTDGEGALISFKQKFGSIKNKKIMVLGTGGTAKAVVAYLSSEIGNTANITLIGRSHKKLKFSKSYKNVKSNLWQFLPKLINQHAIIINCTTIGWGDQKKKSPIKKSILKEIVKSTIIFDVIYDPNPTILLKESKKRKLKFMNGLEMNLQQAVIAFSKVNKFKNLKSIKKYMVSKK